SFFEKVVQRREKRCERFARSCRRGNERVSAFADRRPSVRLRGSGIAESFGKPATDDGVEVFEGHEARVIIAHLFCNRSKRDRWSADCDTLIPLLSQPRRRDAEEQGFNAASGGSGRSRNAVWNVRFCGISSSEWDARRWRRIVAFVVRPEFRRPEFRRPEFRRPQFRRPEFRTSAAL